MDKDTQDVTVGDFAIAVERLRSCNFLVFGKVCGIYEKEDYSDVIVIRSVISWQFSNRVLKTTKRPIPNSYVYPEDIINKPKLKEAMKEYYEQICKSDKIAKGVTKSIKGYINRNHKRLNERNDE